LRKPGWLYKNSEISSHGWNGVHFYVHGKMVCTTPGKGMYVDLRGALQFDFKRQPRLFRERRYGPTQDCKKCTKIWLELYYVFKHVDIPYNRLFPEKEYLKNKQLN